MPLALRDLIEIVFYHEVSSNIVGHPPRGHLEGYSFQHIKFHSLFNLNCLKFNSMSEEIFHPEVMDCYHQYEYYEVVADGPNDPEDLNFTHTLNVEARLSLDEPHIHYFRIVPLESQHIESRKVVYLPPGTIVKFSTGMRSKLRKV
jgi:hypothetical protein